MVGVDVINANAKESFLECFTVTGVKVPKNYPTKAGASHIQSFNQNKSLNTLKNPQ